MGTPVPRAGGRPRWGGGRSGLHVLFQTESAAASRARFSSRQTSRPVQSSSAEDFCLRQTYSGKRGRKWRWQATAVITAPFRVQKCNGDRYLPVTMATQWTPSRRLLHWNQRLFQNHDCHPRPARRPAGRVKCRPWAPCIRKQSSGDRGPAGVRGRFGPWEPWVRPQQQLWPFQD